MCPDNVSVQYKTDRHDITEILLSGVKHDKLKQNQPKKYNVKLITTEIVGLYKNYVWPVD